jgi:hypothetical protein
LIARWEEAANAAAKKLNLDPEEARAKIIAWAGEYERHLSDPFIMETDIFGILALCISYPKAKSKLQEIETSLKILRYNCEKAPHESRP